LAFRQPPRVSRAARLLQGEGGVGSLLLLQEVPDLQAQGLGYLPDRGDAGLGDALLDPGDRRRGNAGLVGQLFLSETGAPALPPEDFL
jgi:hypothetical protein